MCVYALLYIVCFATNPSCCLIFTCACLLEQGRIPFMVPDRVLWPALAQALITKFVAQTGMGLSQTNLSYLGSKLFGESPTGKKTLSFFSIGGCRMQVPSKSPTKKLRATAGVFGQGPTSLFRPCMYKIRFSIPWLAL